MIFSSWPERLNRIAEAAESALARLDFDCKARAWRVTGPPGAEVLLEIAGPVPLTDDALQAVRLYLVPRLNERLQLKLRTSHLRVVNAIPDEAAEEKAGPVPSATLRSLLRRKPGVQASGRGQSRPPGEPADDGVEVKEYSPAEVRNGFDPTAPDWLDNRPIG